MVACRQIWHIRGKAQKNSEGKDRFCSVTCANFAKIVSSPLFFASLPHFHFVQSALFSWKGNIEVKEGKGGKSIVGGGASLDAGWEMEARLNIKFGFFSPRPSPSPLPSASAEDIGAPSTSQAPTSAEVAAALEKWKKEKIFIILLKAVLPQGDTKQEKVYLIVTVHLPEAKRGTNHLGIRSQLRAMRTLLYTFGLGKGEEGGEKGR